MECTVSELIDTTQMYLRTCYELREEGIDLKRARIVERLHQSGPTVSQTVARMERDDLLTVRPDRSLELTDEGRRVAVAVMRRHRLAECLLTDVIGLPRELVHDEACRWEHVISGPVEERLVEFLGEPQVSPFGNAIPPLDAADDFQPVLFGEDSRPLADLVGDEPKEVEVVRLGEFFQATEPNLATAEEVGLRPGVTVRAFREGGDVVVETADGQAQFSLDDAEGIFVADPTPR